MIAVVFNPTARGDRALGFQRRLAQVARGALLLPTTGPGDAVALARQAAEGGADVVVAAGGDGTVNEVLNGLCAVPAGRRPVLAVVPLGTVNVFARELGMPSSPEAAWERVRDGQSRTLDVAVATHGGGCRRFVQLAGAGLDAEAIRRVRRGLKKLAGPLAYVWAGMTAMAGRLPIVEVTGGGALRRCELALVGNGRLYGGGFRVFPSATLDDGMLDVALLERANPLALARALTAAWHGRAERLPGVHHATSAAFEMRSGHAGARFQVEGDDAGALPVRFTVEAAGVRVIWGKADQRRD